ncbi:MAG: hypothetical protein C0594_14625 [Marinilabiliales bacterium]|nr:MAG: hypothetical protein C0594_14625 [Marinilabiliales bacterium]
MKYLILFLLPLISGISISDEKDWNDCIEKYDSKWGEQCTGCNVYKDSFKVFLKNTCNEAVDVQVAMQNTNKKWQVYYKGNLNQGDTLSAWACKGSGKWLYWTRKAGDTEIEFYNEYQINSIYKDY